jgi:hypothetical protein
MESEHTDGSGEHREHGAAHEGEGGAHHEHGQYDHGEADGHWGGEADHGQRVHRTDVTRVNQPVTLDLLNTIDELADPLIVEGEQLGRRFNTIAEPDA